MRDTGLRAGLTHYGDRSFSLFMREAFVKGAGTPTVRRSAP